MFSYFYLVNLLDLLHFFLAGLVTFKVVLAKVNEIKYILYMYLYPAIVMKVIRKISIIKGNTKEFTPDKS